MTLLRQNGAAHGETSIIVLGAGVLGLTTALLLARRGHRQITVVAQHMPGDNHPEYTSIWAGANFVPVSAKSSEAAEWDRTTWVELLRLAHEVPGAGVWLQDKTTYYRDQDTSPEDRQPWFRNMVFGYRHLSRDEVPSFADWGDYYRTVSLDPSIYLHWLQSECLSLGVSFRRAKCIHIRDASELASGEAIADVVVNCTGLLAAKLGGVEDPGMVPIRGQLVIVENDSHGMFTLSGDDKMDKSIGECSYMIPRPAGGGTALGGSSYESWSLEPDMALAERIMRRAIKVRPELVPPGAGPEALRVIRHQVGLRPVRKGGPRIEAETLETAEEGLAAAKHLHVVHCYGSGGFGFQSSYGMANKAVGLVEATLTSLGKAV